MKANTPFKSTRLAIGLLIILGAVASSAGFAVAQTMPQCQPNYHYANGRCYPDNPNYGSPCGGARSCCWWDNSRGSYTCAQYACQKNRDGGRYCMWFYSYNCRYQGSDGKYDYYSCPRQGTSFTLDPATPLTADLQIAGAITKLLQELGIDQFFTVEEREWAVGVPDEFGLAGDITWHMTLS